MSAPHTIVLRFFHQKRIDVILFYLFTFIIYLRLPEILIEI